MAKYLLDTNTLLWWAEDSKRLNPNFRQIIKDGENVIFVSVASVWEIIVKTKLKKLKISTSVENIIKKYGFNLVNIEFSHVLRLQNLPDYHKDPFDRILVVQSLVENFELLTTDKMIKRYLR